LIILGDGILMNDFKIQVQDLQLQDNVLFLGRQQNPFHFFEKALFTMLTSKNEGFPMVLLESLALGTPVVSFNCDSGPSELIQDRQNGLLVENQNQQEMTEALNEMVENQKLYLLCKANSKESVASFSLDEIGKKWISILK
jgi:N-acetylgalactosamine-N,N'-diacetylbacillosaminyl-diphospho-undecaprenol 4-alpha-N-acetylgalactosaminyltransferase